MNESNDNTTALRRVFPPWEFRHLRVWAAARIGGSVVLAVCGLLTLFFGGSGGATYGWAAFFLGLGGLAFAADYWQLTIARSASAQT